MISALDLVLFMRGGKNAIFAQGNKQLDRNVFAYLVDCIDLETGLIGTRHKVSHSRVAGDISERSQQGKKSEPIVFTAQGVRNAIGRMIEIGLYDRVSQKGKGGTLVLRACIEKFSYTPDSIPSHESASKKVNMKLTGSYHLNNQHNQSLNAENDTPLNEKVTINSSYLLTNTPPSVIEAGTRRSMFLSWQPSEEFKKEINKAWPASPEMLKHMKACIMTFKSYWLTQKVEFSQDEWQMKLWRNDLEPLLTGKRIPMASNQGAAQRTPSKPYTPKPKLLKVPDKLFGRVLQDWAKNNAGFREFVPGEDDNQYKQVLRNHIERLNQNAERKVMR